MNRECTDDDDRVGERGDVSDECEDDELFGEAVRDDDRPRECLGNEKLM